MMRIVDIIYSLPDTLMVVLLSVVVMNQVLSNVMKGSIVSKIGPNAQSRCSWCSAYCTGWRHGRPGAHPNPLSIKTNEYVLAARALGAAPGRIIPQAHTAQLHVHHHHFIGPTKFPRPYLPRASLSFIGLGVQSPMPLAGLFSPARPAAPCRLPLQDGVPAVVICLIVLEASTCWAAAR